MDKKTVIAGLMVFIAAGSFYAGMKYDQSQNSVANRGAGSRLAFVSGSRGARNGGDLVSGEVVSKDDKSLTLKLRDGLVGQGGSKIVFFSESTSIMKAAGGNSQDLLVGEQVMVNGTANQDGSINAQSIQLRPKSAQN